MAGLIGAALGVAGSLFGYAKSKEAMDAYRSGLARRRRENEQWYNRNYNEDVTQRADAQRVLNMTEERIRQRNRAAAGRAAVMGSGNEAVAAEKEANNRVMADAVGQVAAAGERRKEAVEQQYMARKDGLDREKAQLELGRANAVAGLADGITKAAGQMDFGTLKLGKLNDENGNPLTDSEGNQKYKINIPL